MVTASAENRITCINNLVVAKAKAEYTTVANALKQVVQMEEQRNAWRGGVYRMDGTARLDHGLTKVLALNIFGEYVEQTGQLDECW